MFNQASNNWKNLSDVSNTGIHLEILSERIENKNHI